MNKTIKYVPIIIIAILAITIIGILIWKKGKSTPIVILPASTSAPISTPIVSENPVITSVPVPTADANTDYGVLSTLGGEKLTDSEIANLKIYHSTQFGITIKIPQYLSGVNNCIESGSTERNFSVPSKVFEDTKNRIIFIVPEYYYEINSCKKNTYSLDLLRKEIIPSPEFPIVAALRPKFGWAIHVENAKSDVELNKFIKNTYGSGCFVEKKIPWEPQKGVYEVVIKGEDWDKMSDSEATTCHLPMSVLAILYAPKMEKVMFANLGQEPTFFTDSTNSRAYDAEMLRSFRFELIK
jgi:hypothetical protein